MITKFQWLTNFAASAAAIATIAAGAAHASNIATISGALVSTVSQKHVSTGPFAGGTLLAGGGNNTFSFLVDSLPVNVHGKLTFMNAGSVDPVTVTDSGNTQTVSQAGFTGDFTEVYTGLTGTVDGYSLVRNVTVLLSGVFDNGVVTGTNTISPFLGGPGMFTADVTSYSSDLQAFGPGGVDLMLILHGSSAWTADGPTSLGTINTHATGVFSATPEPASWALMLVGVGLLGTTLRRKRATAAAA